MHSAFHIRTALLNGCMVLAAEPLSAQSNAIFSGGSDDGYAALEFAQSSSTVGVFNGGNADGYASLEFAQSSSTIGIFTGGDADGWASGEGSNISISLDVYLFLEGPFDPGQLLMRDDLRFAGLVPLIEPYTAWGYPQVAGGGGEVADPALLAISGSDAVVDWVRVELRSASNPSVVVATRQAFVRRDGTVVSGGGGSPLQFGVTTGNSYYVVVRHRNHLGCMTAAPVDFTGGGGVVSFFGASTAVFGTDARKAIGTDRLLWAGDVNGDHLLKYVGAGNDRDPILAAVGGSVPTSILSGQYRLEDVNMEGLVKYVGAANDRDPILSNIGGSVPTNIRTEQVP